MTTNKARLLYILLISVDRQMTRNQFYGITEQSKSSVHRMDDSRALFVSARWRGSMYLAGYSVECPLKVKLMQIFGCVNLEELEIELRRRSLLADNATIFTHQLEVLLRLANGTNRLRQNVILWPLFNIVNRWIPAWRYNPDLSNREDAEGYLNSVDKIRQWIDNNL